MENLPNNTLPPALQARTTILYILRILRCDYLLARLRVVHEGRLVREEAVEAIVEDAGGYEGVDVTDGETGSIC